MIATGTISFTKPNGQVITHTYDSLTDREDLIAIHSDCTFVIRPHRTLNKKSERLLYNDRFAEWEARQDEAIEMISSNKLKIV